MTWFWFNHFNVHLYKSNIRLLIGNYEEKAIRAHALGRFRDLLTATLRDPAMLRYLDNDQNAAGHINETTPGKSWNFTLWESGQGTLKMTCRS
jgi:uncharacterized protein (DUF1800 family)